MVGPRAGYQLLHESCCLHEAVVPHAGDHQSELAGPAHVIEARRLHQGEAGQGVARGRTGAAGGCGRGRGALAQC